MSKIYYISNEDGQVHNINDVDHVIVDETTAEVGVYNSNEEVLMVDDTVTLHTFEEVQTFFLRGIA